MPISRTQMENLTSAERALLRTGEYGLRRHEGVVKKRPKRTTAPTLATPRRKKPPRRKEYAGVRQVARTLLPGRQAQQGALLQGSRSLLTGLGNEELGLY